MPVERSRACDHSSCGSVPQARPKDKTGIGAFLEELHSPKNEPAMAHQEECAGLKAVTAILIEHGPAAMASAFGIIMNVAMRNWLPGGTGCLEGLAAWRDWLPGGTGCLEGPTTR